MSATLPQGLRSEARPYKISELSDSQLRAIERINHWLESHLGQKITKRRQRHDFLPCIDENRYSNVLLIDGQRGSGKTSVLVTLLALWSASLERNRAEKDRLCDIDPLKSPEIAQHLGALARVYESRQIVPVSVLDMQHLPKGSSLLMQLATRLYRIVEACHGALPDIGSAPPLYGKDGNEPKVEAAWLKLVRAIASSEPNLSARRSMTPEDVAVELRYQERERADLSRCWYEFVEALLEDGVRHLPPDVRPADDVRLIIPIDDADMNPKYCVELLELVRSIWHPRVVFLLTGDSVLFVEILERGFRDHEGCKRDRAKALARAVMDKVIPSHQRLKVGADKQAGLRFIRPNLPAPIGRLMDAFPQEFGSVLRLRWRSLQELAAAIDPTMPSDRIAYLLYRRVIEEADQSTILPVPIIEGTVSLADDEGAGMDAPQGLIVHEADCQLARNNQLQPLRIDHIRTIDCDLDLMLRLKFGKDQAILPESVTSALYLAAAVADQELTARRDSRDLTPTHYSIASLRLRLGTVEYPFCWPMPDWPSVADFLFFRRRSRQFIAELRIDLAGDSHAVISSVQRSALTRLAYGLLDLICTLAESLSALDAIAAAAALPTDLDWEPLAHRIVKLASAETANNRRQRAFASWAQARAPLFQWPEFGLPFEAETEFLSCWLRWLWRTHKHPNEYNTHLGMVATERQARLLASLRSADASMDTIFSSLESYISAQEESVFGGSSLPDLLTRERKEWAAQYREKIGDPEAILQKMLDKAILESQLVSAHTMDSLFRADFQDQKIHEEHIRWHLFDRLSQIKANYDLRSSVSITSNDNLLKYVRGTISIWNENYIRDIEDLFMYDQPALIKLINQLDSSKLINDIVSGAKLLLMSCFKKITTVADMKELSDFNIMNVGSTAAYEDPLKASVAVKVDLELPLLSLFTRASGDSISILGSEWKKFPSPIPSLLVVLHDILQDKMDLEPNSALSVDNLVSFTPQLGTVLSENSSQGEVLEFGIPEPTWRTIFERRMPIGNYSVLGEHFVNKLKQLGALSPLNIYGLAFIICANRALNRNPDWDELPLVAPQWRRTKPIDSMGRPRISPMLEKAADLLVHIQTHSYIGRRWEAVRAWTDYGAPLYAAPESGMSSTEASEWLDLWKMASAAQLERMKSLRRNRARLALMNAKRPTDDATVEKLLAEIDDQAKGHPWVTRIEKRPAHDRTGGSSAAPGSEA